MIVTASHKRKSGKMWTRLEGRCLPVCSNFTKFLQSVALSFVNFTDSVALFVTNFTQVVGLIYFFFLKNRANSRTTHNLTRRSS